MIQKFILLWIVALLPAYLLGDSNTSFSNSEKLKGDLKSLNRYKDNLEQSIQEATKELRILNDKKDKLKDTTTLNNEIDKLKEELTHLQSDISENKIEIEKLKSKNTLLAKINTKADVATMVEDDNLRAEIEQSLLQYDNNASITDSIKKMIIETNAVIYYRQNSIPRLKEKKNTLEKQIHQAQIDLKSFNEIIQKSEEKRDLINDANLQLDLVYQKLDKVLNTYNVENDFRFNISLAFIILVALVIGGFYLIIGIKGSDDIVQNLFAGQHGIQFITLFLIIISIILFGIMGTLGGEELSALIGAIAGYILGSKSSQPKSSSSKNPTATPSDDESDNTL